MSRSPDGPVGAGFRAEDAALIDSGGEIEAPIFTIELLGDATMLTMRVGGTLVSVKAAKDFRARIGETINVAVPADICHLFDSETGRVIGTG